MRRAAFASGALALLAACSSTPPADPQPTALTSGTPQAIVARIRAAAGHDDAELAVQPLRDSTVEDLRQSALRLETQGQYPQAAAALDQALAIVADDPALLQERAEAALLLGDNAGAEARARRAFELGAKVGPLCRRHWETVRQVRLLAGDASGATSAQVQRDACKVAGPARY